MRKAIRIKLWQQMPNYRKPASFLVKESYPLPPYSTVIGMVHAACGFTEYHDMDLCIQGRNASDASDYAIMYQFAPCKLDKDIDKATGEIIPRGWKVIDEENGKKTAIHRSPKSVHVLTDVELLIYIWPKNNDDFEIILNSLTKPVSFLSLGRYEDIVRIDEVAEVLLEECDDAYKSPYDMYVPANIMEVNDTCIGTLYTLGKKFGYRESKSGSFREWEEVVTVMHISADTIITSDDIFYDKSLNLPVCFA